MPCAFTVTPAAHQWQAVHRLVLQIGGAQHFVLLSYANGCTAIHRAIDATGTVGGDWWGIAQAASLEECLATFAKEQKLSLETLRSAVGSLTHSVAEDDF